MPSDNKLSNMQIVAVDSETHPIGPEKLAPAVVCTSVAQLTGATLDAFLVAVADSQPKGAHLLALWHSLLDAAIAGQIRLVGIRFSYDLATAGETWPELYPKIFEALEKGAVVDCIIREKLFNLSFSGKMDCLEIIDPNTGKSQKKHLSYSMSSLASKYLGMDLSAAKSEDSWRTRYHELDEIPSAAWPKEAREYPLDDAKITLAIYMAQEKAIEDCQRLYQQGKLPHVPTYKTQEFQSAADFALYLSTCVGFRADFKWKAKLEEALQKELAPEKTHLLYEHGLLRAEIPPQPYKNGARNADGTPKMTAAKAESRDMGKLKALVVDTCVKHGLPIRLTDKGQELFGVDKVESVPAQIRKLVELAVWLAPKVSVDIDFFKLANWPQLLKQLNDEVIDGSGLSGQEYDEVCKNAIWIQPNDVEETEKLLKYVETSSEVIGDLSHLSKILEQYEHRQSLQKLLNTELPRISGSVVHANFDVLKETGRTSSYESKGKGGRGAALYPSFNCQNVHPRARLCFIPRDGWLFFSVDYAALELVSLAQQIHNLYTAGIINKHSRLRDQINNDIDPHAYLGAQLAYNLEPDFAAWCNSSGASSQDDYYTIFASLKKHPVKTKERDFFDNYRKQGKVAGLALPGALGIETFIRYSKATFELILSVETAKKIKEIWFKTYPEMRDCFNLVQNRMQTGEGVYSYQTPMGMIRRGATYNACCNGFYLQSPPAELAKLATFNCTREMYDPTRNSILYGSRILGFIHDELFGEVLDDEHAEAKVMRVKKVMEDTLSSGMPDVKTKAQPCLMRRWNKKAEPVYKDGKLQVWEPEKEEV